MTELVLVVCNGDATHTLLFATDPVADTATWTTVKHTNTRPRTKPAGRDRRPERVLGLHRGVLILRHTTTDAPSTCWWAGRSSFATQIFFWNSRPRPMTR